jgi:hypothetical protein
LALSESPVAPAACFSVRLDGPVVVRRTIGVVRAGPFKSV